MTYQSVLPRLAEAGIITLAAYERQEIEDEIERLIGLLDACDAPIEDLEPDNDDKGADDYGEPDDFGEEDDFGEPEFRNAPQPLYGDDQRIVLDKIVVREVERYRQD